MSSETPEIERVARNIFRMVREGFQINPERSGSGDIINKNEVINESLNVLGLDITTSEQQIIQRHRDLTPLIHPDLGLQDVSLQTRTRAQSLANQARDYLIELEGGGEISKDAKEARERGAPDSPGTGGWGPFATQRQEQYREAFDKIKIFFAEEFLGRNISASSFDEAVRTGKISSHGINRIEEGLREQFGVPELTLDDIARVLASLIVSGSINLGNVERMAGRSGAFSSRGSTGAFSPGGSTGAFSRDGDSGAFRK